MSNEARNTKIESMRIAYPSLHLASGPESPSLVWEGALQPIRFTDEFDAILDDLEHDRLVLIVSGQEHEIRHHPECTLNHDRHRHTSQIADPTRSFTVRVTDFNDGRLPQTNILEPVIPDELREHFLRDGICAYAPWKYPRDEAIVAFVDHSLIWLFKWNVFSQTEPNVWIGSETDHKPEYLLRAVKPTDPCYCGLAKDFQNCCRTPTAIAVYGEPWLQLELWLIRHNQNLSRFEALVRRVQGLYPKPSVRAVGMC